MVIGALLCPRCGVAPPAPVHSPAGYAAATPVGSAPVAPRATSPSTSAGPTPRAPLPEALPVGRHAEVSLLKRGIGLQVAGGLAFIVSLIMDSYSVTTYYFLLGRQVTRYPLLVPGLVLGAIALVLAAVGTVGARRAKAERLARLTSRRG